VRHAAANYRVLGADPSVHRGCRALAAQLKTKSPQTSRHDARGACASASTRYVLGPKAPASRSPRSRRRIGGLQLKHAWAQRAGQGSPGEDRGPRWFSDIGERRTSRRFQRLTRFLLRPQSMDQSVQRVGDVRQPDRRVATPRLLHKRVARHSSWLPTLASVVSLNRLPRLAR
jgi:hypothetical protein